MRELAGVDELAALILRRAAERPSGTRILVGLTGPPGAGKSTAAAALGDIVTAAGVTCAVLPMDGYHLSNDRLAALGRRDRKGAPDTFDATGFAAAVARVRDGYGSDLAFPSFDRTIDASIPDGITVGADVRVVVVEGNYLLLPAEPWAAVRPFLDLSAYLIVSDPVRMARLVARHIRYGMTPDAAIAWATGPDEGNRQMIESSRFLADYTVTLG